MKINLNMKKNIINNLKNNNNPFNPTGVLVWILFTDSD